MTEFGIEIKINQKENQIALNFLFTMDEGKIFPKF
jgi:hypothetical protein